MSHLRLVSLRSRAVLALGVLFAAGLALCVRPDHLSVSPVTEAAPAADETTPILDLNGLYSLRFESRQWADHTDSGLGPLETGLTVEARLALEPRGPGRLAVALTKVRTVAGTLATGALRGLDTVFDDAVDRVVIARYDPRGAFVGLEVPPGVGEAAQGFFQVVAGVLQRTAEGVPEETVLARVDAVWSAAPPGDLRRVRHPSADPAPRHPGATQVELPRSETRFESAADGRVIGVHHGETMRLLDETGRALVVDHLTVDLRRVGETPRLKRPPIAGVRVVGPGQFAPDGRAEADLLRTTAAGLDAETMTRTIRLHGVAGRVPDLSRFLFRAAALLRLEPRAVAALADTYATLPAGAPGRGLVLDLLAQVGTEATQQALVRVLDSEAARQDPRYDVHVQRIGFVPDPSRSLVEFAQAFAADPPAGAEKAAAFGLGAVAGQVARRGRTAEALALAAPLREALDDAETPSARAEALRALGNAGLDEHFIAIRAHADASAPEVRAAVAAAVRKMGHPGARSLLVSLAGDADRDVALAAFDALRGQTLGATELEAFAGLAGGEGLAEAVAGALVNAVAPYREGPLGRRVLATLAARGDLSPGLRARLEALGG
ncbi:HEAT repeat domain-containing protein [Myxococcota bacterium]|nr:HEAT repeat domain-containing protein [Myxococcota bacterium]